MLLNESPIAAQQAALLADVLRDAVRAAADRARDSELTPELAAVAVVKAFQEAQRQLDAARSLAEWDRDDLLAAEVSDPREVPLGACVAVWMRPPFETQDRLLLVDVRRLRGQGSKAAA